MLLRILLAMTVLATASNVTFAGRPACGKCGCDMVCKLVPVTKKIKKTCYPGLFISRLGASPGCRRQW